MKINNYYKNKEILYKYKIIINRCWNNNACDENNIVI